MKILVFAEQRDGQLKSYALEAISEGRRLADAAGASLCACIISHVVQGKHDIKQWISSGIPCCRDLFHQGFKGVVLVFKGV